MRTDKEGNSRTLEQDIQEIWSLHGWTVVEERVSGNTWEITAEVNQSSKPSLNSRKTQSVKNIKLYCKNPNCFTHYIANKKLIDNEAD